MAWGLGWFRKGSPVCKVNSWALFPFLANMRPEESQKLALLACSVRTVFCPLFPTTSHLLQDSTSPGILYMVSHGGRNKRVVLLSWSGHSAERFSFEGKGGQPASPHGLRKRKETSRSSPWGLVVRSELHREGSPTEGHCQGTYLYQSGRYWTDPLSTAVRWVGGSCVCCWGSSALEGLQRSLVYSSVFTSQEWSLKRECFQIRECLRKVLLCLVLDYAVWYCSDGILKRRLARWASDKRDKGNSLTSSG